MFKNSKASLLLFLFGFGTAQCAHDSFTEIPMVTLLYYMKPGTETEEGQEMKRPLVSKKSYIDTIPSVKLSTKRKSNAVSGQDSTICFKTKRRFLLGGLVTTMMMASNGKKIAEFYSGGELDTRYYNLSNKNHFFYQKYNDPQILNVVDCKSGKNNKFKFAQEVQLICANNEFIIVKEDKKNSNLQIYNITSKECAGTLDAKRVFLSSDSNIIVTESAQQGVNEINGNYVVYKLDEASAKFVKTIELVQPTGCCVRLSSDNKSLFMQLENKLKKIDLESGQEKALWSNIPIQGDWIFRAIGRGDSEKTYAFSTDAACSKVCVYQLSDKNEVVAPICQAAFNFKEKGWKVDTMQFDEKAEGNKLNVYLSNDEKGCNNCLPGFTAPESKIVSFDCFNF